jgi:hypothetical protein
VERNNEVVEDGIFSLDSAQGVSFEPDRAGFLAAFVPDARPELAGRLAACMAT